MYFETQKLSVGYHRRPLIEDIDIGIWQGGILCLIGPNGSGKSTILRSITRHLTKLGGVVAIGGRDLDGMSDKELARHVSVVLTDRIEPELMTCWEVVAAGRYPYTNHFGKLSREDQRIVEDSMARVNALELREQRFTELSDGQKQRVLLARALCQQPEVIVLDEPTSYLDIRHKIELLDILREMTASRGLSVVLSLHEVDLATKLADVVVLVKDNAIFRCGAPEDVLDDDTIRQLYDIHDGSFNLLLGSEPIGDAEESGRVKLAVMKLLNEKYGITEDDFTSAELEAVPAVKATDIGLDRSMIGAYGHDDRVCAYAALRALLDLEGTPAKTAVCVLADKEEIGSDGVTGMQSAAFDTFMEDLCESQGAAVRVCFEKSFCLSADVTAAYDPNFSDVYEKRNAAYLNYGIGLCKYTGARGKSGASDADAETVAYIRNLFDEAGVIWQIAELGKVDAGGGGTVAMYMANRNITTLDAGVPVLSMHAPFETVSKLDCYETYKGMKAVFQAEK